MDRCIQRPCRGFTPPRRGGNLSVERLPRVSPWAIFLASLREELHRLLLYSPIWNCFPRTPSLETSGRNHRPRFSSASAPQPAVNLGYAMPITLPQFVVKWKENVLSEHSVAKVQFLDICSLVGHPQPAECDPTGLPYLRGYSLVWPVRELVMEKLPSGEATTLM
jgi:hypothetical protein